MTRGRRIRITLAVLVAVAAWGFFDVRRRTRFDERLPGRTDFTVYTEASKAFFDGRDPYAVTNANGWHYLYPPLFALLLRPLHRLPIDAQAYAWFLLNAAMAWGCLRECRRLAPRAPLPILAAAAVAFALPALNALQRGQVGIFVLYPLLLGLRLVLHAGSPVRALAGGVALALPVALKLTPALPVAALGLQMLAGIRRGKARFFASASGVVLGLFLFFLALPAAAVGWEANLRHLESWKTRVVTNESLGADQNFHPRSVRNQSLGNALLRLGNFVLCAAGAAEDDTLIDRPENLSRRSAMDRPAAKRAVSAVRHLFLLASILLAAWMGRGAGRGSEAAVFGLACAMTLVYSPISWGHHYTLILPAALFAPALVGSRRLAFAIAALVVLHYALTTAVGRVGLLGIGAAAWWAVAALRVSLHAEDEVPAVG